QNRRRTFSSRINWGLSLCGRRTIKAPAWHSEVLSYPYAATECAAGLSLQRERGPAFFCCRCYDHRPFSAALTSGIIVQISLAPLQGAISELNENPECRFASLHSGI